MATTASKIRPRPKYSGLAFHVTVVVEPDGNEFHAYCPALKGLHVSGATIKEALENARIAAQLFLECLIEDGDPIPVGVQLKPTDKPQRVPKDAVYVATLLIHLK